MIVKRYVTVGIATVGLSGVVHAATLTTLPSFNTATDSTATGYNAAGQLYVDSAGDVFGTTRNGGSHPGDGTSATATTDTAGTIFEYNSSTKTTSALYSFTNGNDGEQPNSGLIADAAGNLYGATNGTGNNNGTAGTIFKLGSDHATFTTLATFATRTIGSTNNGTTPAGALTMDAAGNLYGTTTSGGSVGSQSTTGNVFSLATSTTTGTGYSTTPVSLSNTTNHPTSGLTLLGSTLYGVTAPTTTSGQYGYGTIYSIPTTGTATTTIVSLTSANAFPTGKLVADANGNLFGETTAGSGTGSGNGTLFELAAGASSITTLATFTTGTTGTGYTPLGGLIIDAAGNLFGTTGAGGANSKGTVFELANSASGYSNAVTVLASLSSGLRIDGTYNSPLAVDSAGNLYGSTFGTLNSSTDPGTIYEVTGSGYVVAAPEPTSLALLSLGGGALVARRRRRQ